MPEKASARKTAGERKENRMGFVLYTLIALTMVGIAYLARGTSEFTGYFISTWLILIIRELESLKERR